MNREWSELNAKAKSELKKATFSEAISTLLELRSQLSDEMLSWKSTLKKEDFSAIPYINAEGYHSKTVAYSLWHIFRIEDIVLSTLIKNEEQVFFKGDHCKKINSPIITTGNELVKMEIAEFSRKLDIDALYSYIWEVKSATEDWLSGTQYSDLKRRFDESDKERIRLTNTVSTDENSAWLIDYWCGKDIKGLISMPFSRHWIMHVEACLRIIRKL